jgi:hypothetical protein
METAPLLDLSSAAWYQEFYLRERDMGLFEIMSQEDKKKRRRCFEPQLVNENHGMKVVLA